MSVSSDKSQSCETGTCSQAWDKKIWSNMVKLLVEKEHSQQSYTITWFQPDALKFYRIFYSAKWYPKI